MNDQNRNRHRQCVVYVAYQFSGPRPVSRLAVNFTASLAIFVAYSRLSRDFRGGGGLAFSRRLSCSSIGPTPSPFPSTSDRLIRGVAACFLIADFLADHTNGRPYATVLSRSVVCNVMYCG